MSEISKRDCGCRYINTIIIHRKMLTETIERIRFLMDKIEGKEISDLFQDWDKEEEIKSEKKW